MNVICYMNYYDNKKAGKSTKTTSNQKDDKFVKQYEKDVDIQRPCDEYNPVFLFDGDQTDFNYIYVPSWDKYYFVSKPPTFTIGGLLEVSCHEDVLESVWKYLKPKQALIERNEFQFSNYIIDPKQLMETKRNITHLTVGSLGNASGSYIALTVAGGV